MNMYINNNPLKCLRANCLFTNKTTKLAVNSLQLTGKMIQFIQNKLTY